MLAVSWSAGNPSVVVDVAHDDPHLPDVQPGLRHDTAGELVGHVLQLRRPSRRLDDDVEDPAAETTGRKRPPTIDAATKWSV